MAAFSRAPGRPTCKYGDACFRKNAEHWKEFDHSDSHPLLAGSKRDLSAIGSSSSSCCNASEAKRARTMVQDGAIALLCPLSSSSAAAIRLSRGATILGRGSGGLDSLRLSRQHIRLTSVETNAGHVTYDEEPRFLVESIGPNGSEIRSSADGSTAILKPKQTNTAELRISDVLCLLPGDELRFRLEAIAEQHATAGEAAGQHSAAGAEAAAASSTAPTAPMAPIVAAPAPAPAPSPAPAPAPVPPAPTASAITLLPLPPRFTNPLSLPRTAKGAASLQRVPVKLPAPWRGDSHVLVARFGSSVGGTFTSRIAGFDFDNTLSDRRAANGQNMWKSTYWDHLFPSSPAMLRELCAKGYALVVMTNESVVRLATLRLARCAWLGTFHCCDSPSVTLSLLCSLSLPPPQDHLKNAKPLEEQLGPKCHRVASWAQDLGVPVLALIAISKSGGVSSRGGTFHKQPRTDGGNAGMMHLAEELLGLAPGSSTAGSFFVGDAAGRDGDHGDDDKRLAASANVPFYDEKTFFERDPLRLLLP